MNELQSTNYPKSKSKTKWLRKATLVENYYQIGYQNKVARTYYTMALESVTPVDKDILRKALEHLYRKVPVLRVCLRERNSDLWLREMDGCSIDLEVLCGADLEEEQAKVAEQTYNTEDGPLWCVRFLPSEEIVLPSSLQQEKDFTYNYSLIFGVHHSLADGFTNIKICSMLCALVNDVIDGCTISDDKQLGEHYGEEEITSIYNQETLKVKEDPELFKRIKEDLEEGAKVQPLIRHICMVRPDTRIMTRNVVAIFDKATSEKFNRKAKSEGVTLNSALTGLINLALIKLMQESGINQEVYNIRAGHDISLRKYYTGDTSRVLGLHIPVFGNRSSFHAPNDMLPVFWDTVKAFHRTFHEDISSRTHLKTVAYRLMTEDTDSNMKNAFSTSVEPSYYYSLSNMGNLKGLLSEEGKYVSVRRLTRFSSLRSSGTYMVFYVHTFRGQLNINFCYSTQLLTHDFIYRLKELVQIYITSVCEI